MQEETKAGRGVDTTLIRGALKLDVNASSAQVSAGSDFSIFVSIQNPFDVPLTVYQVETHIPIELIDVNGKWLEQARRDREMKPSSDYSWRLWRDKFSSFLKERTAARHRYSGIAIAVGTDFDPDAEAHFVNMTTNVEAMGSNSSIVGIALNFPENPTAEELDRVFQRVTGYQKGLITVTLQPGDSVVKQFVLRTRKWLFFTPLAHTFRIQVNYSVDGIDHTATVSYEQRVSAPLRSTVFGAVAGAIVGAVLKSLTGTPATGEIDFLLASLTAVLSSIAVAIAFARKTTAQPIVSIEDFWGGSLIGFSVGFFGFDQFSGLFKQ